MHCTDSPLLANPGLPIAASAYEEDSVRIRWHLTSVILPLRSESITRSVLGTGSILAILTHRAQNTCGTDVNIGSL
jgi:hypothetical protein